MNSLQEYWLQLTAPFDPGHSMGLSLWQEIEKAYTRSGRHYHDLSHLTYLFKLANEYREFLSDPEIIAFSIFYHDIIYDIKRKDNEEKSAAFAEKRLEKLGLPPEVIKRCGEQIIATKTHEVQDDADAKFLLDFDLAILGESPEKYMTYEQNVRKEYAIYPNILYRSGRRKVLQHFLMRDQIYQTPSFQEKYEQQARINLASELKRL